MVITTFIAELAWGDMEPDTFKQCLVVVYEAQAVLNDNFSWESWLGQWCKHANIIAGTTQRWHSDTHGLARYMVRCKNTGYTLVEIQ